MLVAKNKRMRNHIIIFYFGFGTMSSNTNIKITTVSYEDLLIKNNKETSNTLQASFQKYGIVLISDIPNYTKLKQTLLPMMYNLARGTSKEYLESELTDVKVSFPQNPMSFR